MTSYKKSMDNCIAFKTSPMSLLCFDCIWVPEGKLFSNTGVPKTQR